LNAKPSILSTKKLSEAQKELLLNANVAYVEYDAIKIEFLEAETPEAEIENAIFTSKNAVKAIQQYETNISNCFCVGENTKKLLIKNGQNVVETAQNASDLAKIIVKKYKNASFLFFCGNLRRDELPDFLEANNITLKEQVVYKTYLNAKKFDRNFDGVLFFSPSGIRSHVVENNIKNSISFCIGSTTATEAKKHTNTTIIANKPTVENVIVQAVKYFK